MTRAVTPFCVPHVRQRTLSRLHQAQSPSVGREADRGIGQHAVTCRLRDPGEWLLGLRHSSRGKIAGASLTVSFALCSRAAGDCRRGHGLALGYSSAAWALACAAALSGALAAGFCPVREPIGCWHPWGTAA